MAARKNSNKEMQPAPPLAMGSPPYYYTGAVGSSSVPNTSPIHCRDVLDDWRRQLTDACGTISRVVCEDGGIVSISLSSSGLAGVLSPSIGKLRSLKWLYLDDNNITGEIPQEIGNLSNLTILKLVKNQFNGTIPGSLGHLSELQIIENLLSGNIPTSLPNIPSLNSIILAYNNLSGEITDQLLDVSLYNYNGNHLNCGPYLMSCEGNKKNTGGSRKSNTLGVLLGSIGGAIALLVLICVLVLRRMRHRRGNVPGEHHESLALGHRRQFSLLDLETATGNFSEKNVIGVGSFAKERLKLDRVLCDRNGAAFGLPFHGEFESFFPFKTFKTKRTSIGLANKNANCS
ncbi:hypothetical protein ZWY2020_054336 [Hordeum vulgare]|nr:hypothetical protein ZWY2020_054336 [Hordeum vulgare]